jgi:outer membrane protein assembly factor BamE (lipoprotein component of BamABCDE complex)
MVRELPFLRRNLSGCIRFEAGLPVFALSCKAGGGLISMDSTAFSGVRRVTFGLVALGAAGLGLSACTTADLTPGETLTQGYVIDEQAIELVPVGSSREQVILALGSPSTTATFDAEAYYYISQIRRRDVAFMNPRIVDQRVLAVYFGNDGRVTQIANYGLQDGKVFDFISRTTPTGGRDTTFIGQVLTGVGNFGAPSSAMPGSTRNTGR